MRTVPERFWPLQIVAVFGGFLIGPLASSRMAAFLTPDSAFVQGISGPLFALGFVAATLTWTGFGLASVILSALWRLLRHGRRPVPAAAGERLIPGGYGAYPVFSCIAGVLLGLTAGVATDLRMMTALAAWTSFGAAYGLLLWLAAHHGYLPFLEPE